MSQRKIARYVEAVRDHRTLLSQREAFPELAKDYGHARSLTEALAAVHVQRRALTGGELGLAHRLLDRKGGS